MKQIQRSEVEYLWHVGYWDGPLSGICIYNDEVCWFQNFSEDFEPTNNPEMLDRIRKFKIYRLSQEQLKFEYDKHACFQQHVGTHCDYDKNKERHVYGNVKPQSEWKKFYEIYKPETKVDYSKNECLGWYQDE